MLVLCSACLFAQSAAADQNDARLDNLFERLRAAPDPRIANGIAREIWGLWITHEDDAINALMSEGQADMARRNYHGALGAFEKMVGLAPQFAEGWNKRATVHWLLGNYGESLADIERTLALEPRHFGALSGRGLVYSALEKWDLALESFAAALEVHPQMIGPRVNIEAIRRLLQSREL